MSKSLVPISITALLVGACSLAQYQVNPQSVEEVKEIPESEQAGYMRILGDLQWDQLTSQEEWMARFPECLTNKYYAYYPNDLNMWLTKKEFETRLNNSFPINREKKRVIEYRKCKNFLVGGIPLSPDYVEFGSNSGTSSKSMATMVSFRFFDDSQSRAVKATIAKKYPGTSDGHCSKYTCWNLGDDIAKAGGITARPTPYTVSLLDQVTVDTSDF